jgi:membrane-bound ClpP family serine protease
VGRTLPTRRPGPGPRRPTARASLWLVTAALLSLTASALGLGLVGASGASAATSTTSSTVSPPTGEGTQAGYVAVFKVSGLLDPVMVNSLVQAVDSAASTHAKAIVLQANSGGVVVSDPTFADLLRRLRRSSVPVDIWIGPSGSHLTGPAAQLLGVSREVGMAPGTSVGNSGPPVAGVVLDPRRLNPLLRDRTVGSGEAAKLGVTTLVAPTLGDFVVHLPGV